ncbi:MAG: PP2C family protein-serine/threonine phosphatase [Planctomycetes bacterium]|nr:PP2C family protein-serine/threonine phosphatase [Planctomycetota bacterium]
MIPDRDLRDVFETASLRSERHRILGLLVFFGALGLFVLIRTALAGDAAQLHTVPMMLGIIAVAGAYEAWMLWRVSRALRQLGRIAARLWILNVILESSLPTAGLFMLTESEFMGPYRALVAPSLLLYPMFVILSTLQLRPILSVLSATVSAGGYVAAVVYTFLFFDATLFGEIVLPAQLYATYPVFLLGLGGIAAFVSSRLRRYVRAGLEEGIRRQRIEGDLELARSIQLGLLPNQPPVAEGYEIAGWNEPADQTGGDYYDWLQMPDGRIAITIADVTGHGIGPALMTAVCRAYARASIQGSTELTSILARINHLMHEDLPDNRFVTFVLASLDPAAHVVEFLSAGHGPILCYSASSGTIAYLKADSVPLGILPDIEYDEPRRMVMKPGDLLVLVTDGFFEWARADGIQYGITRLGEFICRNATLPASTLIERLHESVRAFVGSTTQQDDLTAVIVKRMKEGPSDIE